MADKILYVIKRIGGWDGISVQSRLWIKVLLSLGKEVTIAAGDIEEKSGTMDVSPFRRARTHVISEMSLDSQSWLFRNAFKQKYERKAWLKRFIKEKDSIRKELNGLVEENDVIITHNLSIKHIAPASWAALYEIATENPGKRFISIDADSPYERGLTISDMSPEVLWIIGNPDIWCGRPLDEIDRALTSLHGRRMATLPGPIPLENVIHVSFNNYQSRVIQEIYGIGQDNFAKIPDMGEFSGPHPWRKLPRTRLLSMISEAQVVNPRQAVTRDDIFIVSPVRPIYRKNLKHIAYLADQYRLYLRENGQDRHVFLIITHPTDKAVDMGSYWKELKKEVEGLGITLVHMADSLLLRRKKGRSGIIYNEFMWSLSRLNSISIVGSMSGAWENGIVESTEAMLPVSVNPMLPAYQDMIMMGFRYIPVPITRAARMKERGSGDKSWINDASIESFFGTMSEVIFDRDKRKEIVEHNFSVGKERLSLDQARPTLEKILG